MNKLKVLFSDLQQRRKILAIVSGSLIAVAFGANALFGWRAVYTISMVAAALVAGWDIALRAITSLRNRYISIELLVTVATLGALLIGEY